MIPAIASARNGWPVAIASRGAERARRMAVEQGVRRVHDTYEGVLRDPEVDAVYIPLVNSLHREWTLRALEAGKHVLCEKPLAMNAAEAEEMAHAAYRSGRVLMEAVMYRFHPRMRRLRQEAGRVIHLSAEFGFPLDDTENYRLRAELGGGALLDVGCYCVDVARWFLGDPDRVTAAAHVRDVDLSVAASLGFPDGATASLWGSFESPEHQRLTLITDEGAVVVETPFTAWKDPDDPYQLMVEAFADTVLDGEPSPLPLEDSIANLRVMDAIRRSFETPPAR